MLIEKGNVTLKFTIKMFSKVQSSRNVPWCSKLL